MSFRPHRLRLTSILALSLAALLLLPSTQAAAAPGDIDLGFNGSGYVVTNVGTVDQAYDVAVDSNDRVVVAGFAYSNGSGSREFGLVRYNDDGSLDDSFGAGGKVMTDIGGAGFDDTVNAVAIQPNDKIVVAGTTAVDAVTPAGTADFAVARYDAGGTLDPAFGGGDGYVTIDFGGDDSGNGIAIDSNGDIAVAGSSHSAGMDFAVAKLDSSGSLDSSFDGDGLVTTDINGGGDAAAAVVFDSNHRIIAVGAGAGASNRDFALARYDTDGGLDTSFDGDGKVSTNGTDRARAVVIDGSGDIVVAGSYFNIQTRNTDFGLARYSSNGSLDLSFGPDGTGKLNVPMRDGGQAEGLALDSAGHILAGGFASNGSDRDFALARFESDGTLSTTFGTGGKAFTNMGTNDSGRGVAVDSAERIVMGGYTNMGDNADFAAVRYASEGYRPDGLVKKASVAAYSGDDVYNSTGNGQTVLTKTKRGRLATFQLKVQNDGTGSDAVTVDGCASSKGFVVTYANGVNDITADVTAGTYAVTGLAPGQEKALTMSIKVARSVSIGKIKGCPVSTTSQTSPTEEDVVLARVKTVA
jgi:uncharacterized delta-60 repeat protein